MERLAGYDFMTVCRIGAVSHTEPAICRSVPPDLWKSYRQSDLPPRLRSNRVGNFQMELSPISCGYNCPRSQRICSVQRGRSMVCTSPRRSFRADFPGRRLGQILVHSDRIRLSHQRRVPDLLLHVFGTLVSSPQPHRLGS
jgi:hypothetical protein